MVNWFYGYYLKLIKFFHNKFHNIILRETEKTFWFKFNVRNNKKKINE